MNDQVEITADGTGQLHSGHYYKVELELADAGQYKATLTRVPSPEGLILIYAAKLESSKKSLEIFTKDDLHSCLTKTWEMHVSDLEEIISSLRSITVYNA